MRREIESMSFVLCDFCRHAMRNDFCEIYRLTTFSALTIYTAVQFVYLYLGRYNLCTVWCSQILWMNNLLVLAYY